MVPVNYFAVVTAAVISMVLGFLWYGPIFGKPWMAMMGITPNNIAAAKEKGGMGTSYVLMMVGSLFMSYVLAHSIVFAGAYLAVTGVSAGLQAAFWNWLGFIAPVTLGTVLWENKPWKLWFINAGYYLVSLCLMGITLALWK